jgi:hypothetical protein
MATKPSNHIRVWKDGKRVLLHRVLMEEHLGRPLAPGEVVHHRNGDQRDNRIENLEVLPSQAAHAALHGKPCEPGCTCKRHNAFWRKPCEPGCTCGRHYNRRTKKQRPEEVMPS